MDKSLIMQEMKETPLTDTSKILKLARKYSKVTIDATSENKLKVAVLGQYSTQHFVMVLRLLLESRNIPVQIYEGEYNGITSEILDKSSKLYDFAPNIVIILTDYRYIKSYPNLFANEEEINAWLQNQFTYWKNLWLNLNNIPNCKVFQTNFVYPLERQLGNLETNYPFSRYNCLRKLNINLESLKMQNVSIIDMEYFASNVGKLNWFDESAYFLHKIGFKLDYLPQVVDIFAQQIAISKGYVKKCLVLDLDNTLWGGIVGDDGYNGIQIDPNNAVGEAYLAFQQYILTLKERGIILSVCSKNEENIAKEPFLKNPYMKLKLSDFAVFVANWQDKSSNLRSIAQRLNIGLDSFVFFDDNPAEREIVQRYCPEVQVIDVPDDPALYIRTLDQAQPFEWAQLTKEDINRNDSYIENQKREELAINYTNYEEYLSALKMRAKVSFVTEATIERFIQLTNKSNQFNLRTQRYDEPTIQSMRQNDNYRLLTVELTDKFSQYGIIACVVLHFEKDFCFIENWVMSCRVLKRDVEYLTFKNILIETQKRNCQQIKSEYIPTAKNHLVENLLLELGFKSDENDPNKFTYPVSKIFDKKYYIEES